ncbi:MAG: aminopeptidase N [Magnetococcales bacterium]|nr:aminopeptidase N [Magnetococcales bacterium]
MVEKSKKIQYLKDYRPYPFRVERVDLTLDLHPDSTRVGAKIQFERDPDCAEANGPLVLNGLDLKLLSLSMDGLALPPDRYLLTGEYLTISHCPDRFVLETEVEINPKANSSLEGLFASGNILCSQCEAEGFRKITFFPDRPDVMAPYTTRLIGNIKQFPVLLSNGNLVESGLLDGDRHFAVWEDPFRKPSYLFAVVAGDLVCREDRFTTCTDRVVDLKIFVEKQNSEKCDHALASLKKAMAWDEKRYGLVYDLDIYMIVAVDDFNMGAMENKGLNLFNAKYVLAQPQTATDTDYHLIEAVIGHEYFHNWSGNRVTCRDWFQLSLKEGLTVFREQEFSGESTSEEVQRIQDVSLLRSNQFPEDAGPTAHPVQPHSYLEINNFYTLTIYEKGAELVGMIKRLLGAENYHRGIDLYFQRHDGEAVTVDDFIAAMEAGSGRDLAQFKRWYQQAGTPLLTVSGHYDPQVETYTLTITQSTPPTPGQEEKKPLHIPLAMGLLDRNGEALPLTLVGEKGEKPPVTERVLELTQAQEQFTFRDIPHQPIPSLLRGFSAPVRLQANLSDKDLAFLWSHDRDTFNRWEGGQELATRLLLPLIESSQSLEKQLSSAGVELFVEAFAKTLNDDSLLPSPRSLALTLPSEKYLLDRAKQPDPQQVHRVRQEMRKLLSNRLLPDFERIYKENSLSNTYQFTPEDVGRRGLRNLCLHYLLSSDNVGYRSLALDQYHQADNMTDRLAALSSLSAVDCPERIEALSDFEQCWKQEPLVMDKWFSLQAMAPLPDTLNQVKRLMNHPLFTLKTPNRVRALIGAFCHSNPYRFHTISGEGYLFLSDQVVALNRINPQIAARLLMSMSQWRHMEPKRQKLMHAALQQIAKHPGLSRDVYEIVTKILA